MSHIFLIAYKNIEKLSQKECGDILRIVSKLLPIERTSPSVPEVFERLFPFPPFKKQEEMWIYIIHLYNLCLTKAKGQELPGDYEEYLSLLSEYERFEKAFPHVEIDDYSEDVLKAYAFLHKDKIEKVLPNPLKEKIKKCRQKPYISKTKKGYFIMSCSGEAGAINLAHRKEIDEIYVYAVLCWYSSEICAGDRCSSDRPQG